MNKHTTLFTAGLIALAGLAGCSKNAKNAQSDDAQASAAPNEMTTIEHKDADSLLHIEVAALLPAGEDAASTAMRDTLLNELQRSVKFFLLDEENSVEPAKDIKGVKGYLEACAKRVRDQRLEDDKEYGFGISAPYEWTFKIDTVAQAEHYLTFDAYGYVYTGGAHGGVIGRGAITFRKADGKPFTNWFANPADGALQKLLLENIANYFSQDAEQDVTPEALADYLLVSPDDVELPFEDPCPTADGLRFTYQQYEIAPYAAGMPNFIISYDQVKPFLTDEAKELLGL